MTTPETAQRLSPVLVTLLRGVTYRDADPSLWTALLALEARVRDYVAQLGLELVLDEAEGHAFLRQRAPADGEEPIPRLIARRPLSYPVSLLLALLRRKLAESDSSSGDTRLILARDEIVDLARVFLPGGTNETRLLSKMDSHIQKVVELGFLRPLRERQEHFEVRRILKAFVDAQWLQEFEQRLAAYRNHGATDEGDPT